MSDFKLGGVPAHAYDLFYLLRDRVQTPDGKRWSVALKAMLDTDDPDEALRRLLQTDTSG